VSGAVYCWGVNNKAQLGSGRPGPESLTPVRATGVHEAISVSTGVAHACVLLRRGGAECWGYDDYGQLGDGPDNKLLRAPVRVVF
jgi:alpha-tubulin suppressor-like RCC1 family protein